MNSRRLLGLSFAVASMFGIACTDESSSSQPIDVPVPPSSASVIPMSSGVAFETPSSDAGGVPSPASSETAPVALESSSSAGDVSVEKYPASFFTAGCAEGEVPVPVQFPLDSFTDIGEIYKNIQCDEKVVFLLRHGEREPYTDSESSLTEDGIEAAKAAGAKLVGTTDFAFVHSGFLRTYQTVLNIAIGRGQANFTDDTIPQLADGWYRKDRDLYYAYQERDSIKNANVMIAAWAYDSSYADAFYDLETRSLEMINTYVIKDYEEMPKYTVMASHDQLLMPLTVWASKRLIDLKLHVIEPGKTRYWLNYLAGVAVIVNSKNEVRYAPVKGMEKGVQ